MDTGAWIALLDGKDKHHESAASTYSRLRAADELLLTGWHTLVELIDGLAARRGQAAAGATLRQIRESPHVQIEPSEPYREAALELFWTRPGWGVDLSDCLSFALMEAKDLRRAFTYDPDFGKAGFERVG